MERALEDFVWRRAGVANTANSPGIVSIFLSRSIISSPNITWARPKQRIFALLVLRATATKGRMSPGFDPRTRKIVPLFHPRRHKWSRHFRWEGPVLVGRTPSGRATVITLKFNLEHRVDLRQGLIDEGIFPPG
jgi:hypothetical protein